jgi:hypothetical protein
MDDREYEFLTRRNRELIKRAREVVDKAHRIRQEFRHRSSMIHAWNARIEERNKADAKRLAAATGAVMVTDSDLED